MVGKMYNYNMLIILKKFNSNCILKYTNLFNEGKKIFVTLVLNIIVHKIVRLNNYRLKINNIKNCLKKKCF